MLTNTALLPSYIEITSLDFYVESIDNLSIAANRLKPFPDTMKLKFHRNTLRLHQLSLMSVESVDFAALAFPILPYLKMTDVPVHYHAGDDDDDDEDDDDAGGDADDDVDDDAPVLHCTQHSAMYYKCVAHFSTVVLVAQTNKHINATTQLSQVGAGPRPKIRAITIVIIMTYVQCYCFYLVLLL